MAQILLSQGLDAPMVVQEEIYFESLSDSNCTLFHLLIAPIQNKQDIHHRAYSVEPDSVVLRKNKYFAVWNRAPNEKAIKLKITTVIEKFGPHTTVSYKRRKKDTYVETEGNTFTQRVNRSNRTLWDLADEKYNNQESDDAIFIYDMLIELDPKNHRSYLFKGVSLARVGEYDEALFHLETAEQFAEKEFDKAHITFGRANICALKGEKRKCISYINKAIEQGLSLNMPTLLRDQDIKEILTREEMIGIISRAREIEREASYNN